MSFTAIAIIIARLYILTAPTANCSWYGKEFHGGITTSGLTYNMYEWTCASTEIPMGSILWCYSEDTNIWCYVRITDGGPYAVDSEGNPIYPLKKHPTRQLDLAALPFFFLSGGRLWQGTQHIRYRVIDRDITGMPYPGSREVEILNTW